MAETRTQRRTPQAGRRNKLSVTNKEDGFVYRVVNDLDGRVAELMERGYEVVKDESVQVGDKRVAKDTPIGSPRTVAVGGGIKGVLMRQREDYYNEDQATKEAAIREVEAQMERALDVDGQYGKIKISRE